jgi:hypothetical protein
MQKNKLIKFYCFQQLLLHKHAASIAPKLDAAFLTAVATLANAPIIVNGLPDENELLAFFKLSITPPNYDQQAGVARFLKFWHLVTIVPMFATNVEAYVIFFVLMIL